MTKGVESGDRSKSGHGWDGSSQGSLESYSESLGPASGASTPVEGLPLEQEPRLFTMDLSSDGCVWCLCYADIAGDVCMGLMMTRWSRDGAINYRSWCMDCGRLCGPGMLI